MSATVRVLVDHVNLPQLSSVFVPVGTNAVMCGEALIERSVELLLRKGIGIARGVTELKNGRAMALVTNFRAESLHLTKDTAVGYVEKLRDSIAITVISEDTSPTQPMRTPPSELDIDPTLPGSQRRKMTEVLSEFSDCFAT